MRLWRLPAVLGTCLALIAVTALSAAAQTEGERDLDYLALGDSVAFGLDPLLDPGNPANFVGYPDVLGGQLNLPVTNASCSGQTSSGLISLAGTDNGCFLFRTAYPLHVSYTTSQLDFAFAFLQSHPRTRLITLDVGANDLFLLEQQCDNSTLCIQNALPGLLVALSSNLASMYTRIQLAAPYRPQVIALTYYAPNYNDPLGVQVISAINLTVALTTLAAGGRVADGFDAFRVIAAQRGGGDACAAGLLIALPTGGCDMHASALGQDVLAHAIREVLRPGSVG